jgi:hypothetical protein
MKKTAFCLMIILGISYLTGCAQIVHHSDPFYNFKGGDFPRDYLPLIDPIEATRESPSSPWSLELDTVLWVKLPNSQEYYMYSSVDELEKFSVKGGVIVVYSSYVDHQADAYVQNNFYHWFAIIPTQKVIEGFHTEGEFDKYIQTLGVQNPDWQTPDEAFDKFAQTGCLDWIPDCK